MSYEGGVMPAEVVLNTTPERVIPLMGKGALGKWRASAGNIIRTLSRAVVSTHMGVEPGI